MTQTLPDTEPKSKGNRAFESVIGPLKEHPPRTEKEIHLALEEARKKLSLLLMMVIEIQKHEATGASPDLLNSMLKLLDKHLIIGYGLEELQQELSQAVATEQLNILREFLARDMRGNQQDSAEDKV